MAPTVAVRPIQTPQFRSGSGLYSIHEHDGESSMRRHRQASEPSIASRGGQRQEYPVYSGLQTSSSSDLPRSFSDLNVARSRPRLPSHGSTPTLSTNYSWEPESRNPPPRGRRTSLAAVEPKRWPPVERMYNRPEPLKKPKPRPQPNELFDALPGEVLALIIGNMASLHLGRGSDSCATCWMRDLCSIALSCRKLARHARTSLYQDIQLVGQDSAVHKKKLKMTQGGRMVLLRRTLRMKPELAHLVCSLKVPQFEHPPKGTSSKTAVGLEHYEDLVATLIMACPNLEQVSGVNTAYDHAFRRIFHALSTRKRLQQMDWLVEASAEQRQQRMQSEPKTKGLITPAELLPAQEDAFKDCHRNWRNLHSLSVHCLPGAALTPTSLLVDTFSMLPSLRNLHLCNLPDNAFNDTTLLALPRLETLSLSHIAGITSSGLSAFATRTNSFALRHLHLRHASLTSLPALARILSNLTSLKTFSLVQAFPPVMPEADSFTLWMMPYLASTNMTKLHWDITAPSLCANAADGILARSIAAGGFPRMVTLRTPNDPEGIFQDLCRPLERVDLPMDKFRSQRSGSSDTSSPPSSPKATHKPYTLTPPPTPPGRQPVCTNLNSARLAAQTRLENSRSKPRFHVQVHDEDGSPAESFDMAGYVGTVGSTINYHLLPDPGTSDERGGLLDLRDLMADGGESLAGDRGGCIGAWNREEGVVADKKEKERWWHTERGRWRKIELHQI